MCAHLQRVSSLHRVFVCLGEMNATTGVLSRFPVPVIRCVRGFLLFFLGRRRAPCLWTFQPSIIELLCPIFRFLQLAHKTCCGFVPSRWAAPFAAPAPLNVLFRARKSLYSARHLRHRWQNGRTSARAPGEEEEA